MAIKRSKEVQEFLDNGGKITVITPEQTAKTLEKQSGGYFKGRSVIGPSKKKGNKA